MLCVGTVFRGLRQITSNEPITGTEDIVGLKLRLPGVPTWIAVWEELEADVVAVPLTGLYAALDSGLAEASEGDLTQIYFFNLFEVQSQLTITNHLVAVGWITLNDDFFKKLPVLYKGLVLTAIYEASEWATEKIQTNENALLEKLQAEGMTVGYADAEAIRIKAKPAATPVLTPPEEECALFLARPRPPAPSAAESGTPGWSQEYLLLASVILRSKCEPGGHATGLEPRGVTGGQAQDLGAHSANSSPTPSLPIAF